MIRRGWHIHRFRLAAEQHCDIALRIELDHHVAVAVYHPDIVVAVDAHLLGGEEAIDLPADLADELAVRTKFIKTRTAMREGAAGANHDDRIGVAGIDKD